MIAKYDTSGSFFFDGRAKTEACVRRPEADDLLNLVKNGNRVFIDANRRTGKTTLVMNTMEEADIPVLRIDLQSVASMQKLVERIDHASSNFLRKYPSVRDKLCSKYEINTEIGGSLMGILEAKIGGKKTMGEAGPKATLDGLLGLVMDTSNLAQGTLFFDEFQSVKEINDHPGEALGSFAVISDPAYCGSHAPVIFAGSNRHAMHRIFSGNDSTFYHHTHNLRLGPIEPELILPFLENRMGKPVAPGVSQEAYDWTEGITGDLQRVFSALKRVSEGKDHVSQYDLVRAKSAVVEDLGKIYALSLRNLGDSSLRVLDIIAQQNLRDLPTLGTASAAHGMRSNDLRSGVEELSKAGMIHLPIPETTIVRPEPLLFHYIQGKPAWKHRPFSRAIDDENMLLVQANPSKALEPMQAAKDREGRANY